MSDLRKAAEIELKKLEDIARKTPTTHVRAGKATIGDKEHVALWFDDSSDPIQQADYINQTKPEKMLAMIEALRQALAQPEQEPVAWFSDRYGKYVYCEDMTDYPTHEENGWKPLYTAPPKREWVGLSSLDKTFLRTAYAQLRPLYHDKKEDVSVAAEVITDWDGFFAAIDAKLKEKNT